MRRAVGRAMPAALSRWRRDLGVVSNGEMGRSFCERLIDRRRYRSSATFFGTDLLGCRQGRLTYSQTMRYLSIKRAMSALVAPAFGAFVVIPAADAAVQQKTPPPPPPPVQIYYPQSGPFIVRVDSDGHIQEGQNGVVANAVRMWSGDYLQAFVICFRSSETTMPYDASESAITTVARALKAHGARIVVTPNGGRCGSAYQPRWTGAYVEIEGVVVR